MKKTKKEMYNLAANLVSTLTYAKDEFDKNGASFFFIFLLESSINIAEAMVSSEKELQSEKQKEGI